MALEINPSKAKNRESASADLKPVFTFGKKVSNKDRILFIEQLALMLETGSDLHTSLKILAKHSGNRTLAEVIAIMADDIGEGKTFSAALSRHPHIFSETYVSLVAASESGGYLLRILEHLLEMEKQQEELRSTLISAISYPAFLLLFSIGMVIFILAVVFPKFGTLFTSIQDQLPLTTLYLMALSRIIAQYWWGIGLGLFAAIMLSAIWLKSDGGNRFLDKLKMTMPGLKNIFIKVYLIQAMSILALSLKNGINLVDALKLAKGVVKNRGFNQFLDRLLNDVTEGQPLAHAFNTTDFVPPIVRQMISTGEQTGSLALVSDRIADYFQRDLEKLLKIFAKAIEPILLLVMGAVVGVLVSSLILPIFKLSHAVH